MFIRCVMCDALPNLATRSVILLHSDLMSNDTALVTLVMYLNFTRHWFVSLASSGVVSIE